MSCTNGGGCYKLSIDTAGSLRSENTSDKVHIRLDHPTSVNVFMTLLDPVVYSFGSQSSHHVTHHIRLPHIRATVKKCGPHTSPIRSHVFVKFHVPWRHNNA